MRRYRNDKNYLVCYISRSELFWLLAGLYVNLPQHLNDTDYYEFYYRLAWDYDYLLYLDSKYGKMNQ